MTTPSPPQFDQVGFSVSALVASLGGSAIPLKVRELWRIS
jgi:hypothetical protein